MATARPGKPLPTEKLVTVRECPKANCDIEIAYETFGDPTHPPVLLIMGMNAQMLLWPEDFCKAWAARGYYVIRFDNRDCGLSTKVPHMTTPSVCSLVCLPNCCASAPAYTLEDFALDAVALLDTLKIPKAHIVGQSMGGMIAQIIASKHPDRCLSLMSIYSTTNDPKLPEPTLKTKLALAEKPKNETREEYIRVFREMGKVAFYPPGMYDQYSKFIDDLNGTMYDRIVYTEAITRHAAAVVRAPNRNDELKNVRCPTLVLHGRQDVLVDPRCGEKTHECIPHSQLVKIDNMGHSILPCHFESLLDAFERHCAKGVSAQPPFC